MVLIKSSYEKYGKIINIVRIGEEYCTQLITPWDSL